MDYEGQRRRGSYWTVHGFHDLPVTMDLPAVPEQSNLALSADEKNRFVRAVSLSWLNGESGQPRLHVEYESESADLAAGQGWTSCPSWFPAVFAGLERPVYAGNEVSVRFWGLVWYSPYASEEQEVELLLAVGRKLDLESETRRQLVSIGDPALPALRRMLKSTSDTDQSTAWSCIAGLCAREFVPEVIASLDSRDWSQAEYAAGLLGRWGEERAVDPLLKVLRGTKNYSVLFATAGALGMISDKRAVPALERLLSDEDPSRKLIGAYGLGLMGRRDGLEVAIAALKTNRFVEAIRTLHVIGGTEAEKALTEYAGHNKGFWRQQALLSAKLVAARGASAEERRTIVGELLQGKFAAMPWMTYEVQRLPADEGLAIFRDQMERAQSTGDRQAVTKLRNMMWTFLAEKARPAVDH
jgi:HEAT repeat protein